MEANHPYQIVLAVDGDFLGKSIRGIIKECPDLLIAGEANDGPELFDLLENTSPEMVILDISLPKTSGMEAAGEVKHLYPEVKVLVLTKNKSKEELQSTLSSGVEGYLLAESASEDLIPAIHGIKEGSVCISSDLDGDQPNKIRQERESPVVVDYNTSAKWGRLTLKVIVKALRGALGPGNILSWVFWALEVYAWMIILHILTSGFLPSSFNNNLFDLFFTATNPGLTFLEKQIPPVVFSGVFYYEPPVFGILTLFLMVKFIHRAVLSDGKVISVH